MSWSVDRPIKDHITSHHTAEQLWVKLLSAVEWVISVGQVPLFIRHLDENVLHHLVAVVVHTYVTGEGLAQEYISV